MAAEKLGLNANSWRFLSKPRAYVEASQGTSHKLSLASTQRQFKTAREILARLNGGSGHPERRGVLLADDVGLGKTTVAALVAWVVASSGEGRSVRILAPNDVMRRRWEDEIKSHQKLLIEIAPHLHAEEVRIRGEEDEKKRGRVKRLRKNSIQIAKHSHAKTGRLTCDLLIIDEAHRAKGDGSEFGTALRSKGHHAKRALVLTATPFSIDISEFGRMLDLVGGGGSKKAVKDFGTALNKFYEAPTEGPAAKYAEQLVEKALAAVNAIQPFVIRHAVDDLSKREQESFGDREEWKIEVPVASESEMELIIRMDRAARLEIEAGRGRNKRTNDPRFHVGWRQYGVAKRKLERIAENKSHPAIRAMQVHLSAMGALLHGTGTHPKMEAVAREVCAVAEQGEKVFLFCDHHATAQELTESIAKHLRAQSRDSKAPRMPAIPLWREAWERIIEVSGERKIEDDRRLAFINWLTSDYIRGQTWSWIRNVTTDHRDLAKALQQSRARGELGFEPVAEAAKRLLNTLLNSRSGSTVLRNSLKDPALMAGGAPGAGRLLAVCEADEEIGETLFDRNREPDTVLAIFNSPFGPDVLVGTDRLSEGIDLHRYCRHLVHYELDPSPIRTVQREGRVRRVNSWAAAAKQPILCAYPLFRGTRDEKLVGIMRKRLDSFSLLLGGARDFDPDRVDERTESWRSEAIGTIQERLKNAGARLAVH